MILVSSPKSGRLSFIDPKKWEIVEREIMSVFRLVIRAVLTLKNLQYKKPRLQKFETLKKIKHVLGRFWRGDFTLQFRNNKRTKWATADGKSKFSSP